MLPFIVLGYFSLHSYLLQIYHYTHLFYHMIYIILLRLYLGLRKQSQHYCLLRQIVQKRQKQQNQQNQQKQQLRICPVCNRVKPSRYYHCRKCNVCIYRMDHHCQWVGNCIGQFNSKPYFHLLFNLLVHNVLIILQVFVWNFKSIVYNQDRSVYLTILIIPIIFMLFETQRLLKDFYYMIKTNQTLIESYKKVRGKDQSFLENLSEFFGTSTIILWFIPIYFLWERPDKSSDLLQNSLNVQQALKQPKELTYADQYIYGKDDQELDFEQKKQKKE